MIKRLLIYGLILGFVFQTCISSLLIVSSIKSHKLAIKKICKELIKKENYKSNLVVFNEKELEKAIWEHSKEFFLGDSKYDVVSTEIYNGVKLFLSETSTYCLYSIKFRY